MHAPLTANIPAPRTTTVEKTNREHDMVHLLEQGRQLHDRAVASALLRVVRRLSRRPAAQEYGVELGRSAHQH